MPIYEYVCEKCNHKFEKLVRNSNDNDKPECPKCGSNETKKVFSAFSCGNGATGSSGNLCGG